MVNITRNEPAPVPTPPPTYTIELSAAEAQAPVNQEQNYGDHGEVHTFALDAGPDVTVGELVGKLWGGGAYRQGPLNVVFTKAEVYPFAEERF